MAEKITRTWILNGEQRTLAFRPMRRLLDVLRQDLDLLGTKEGCGEGECGACTVLLNGKPVCACLVPAGQVLDGDTLLTVEGLERTETGRRLQDAFVETGAAQCGICIPGMLMSSYALLSECGSPDTHTIREAHAGNLCRCTGYEKIVEAVERAAAGGPREEKG